WIGKHADQPFFLYLPFNAQHAPLQAPKKYLDRFTQIENEKRRTFAAMLSAMDDAVGRVLAKVREINAEENTIVWYFADNGGPTLSTTSGNGPLHGYKSSTSEGGTRVPFMVQWKGKIPAGGTYTNPIIQLDVMPTVLAAAGVKIDAAWGLDGVDLMPFLAGVEKGRPHPTLYWRFGEQWAVRDGDHKLVVSRVDGKEPRLINLADDIGEAKDLSADQPEKVKELRAKWDEWNKGNVAPVWAPGPGQPAKKAAKAAKKAAKKPAVK
ncbi:MAG: sulfatase family protein, partial [Planctomycetia bacterium]